MLTLEQNPTAISNGFISKILDKWAYGHLLVPVTALLQIVGGDKLIIPFC
uniref:Uncharacterized protein n=1 Tax=Enterobacter cloacae TaxID=550 RepID=A0A482M5D4_ENTCL|nr:hypothetical protein [Enterobacter cloacae]